MSSTEEHFGGLTQCACCSELGAHRERERIVAFLRSKIRTDGRISHAMLDEQKLGGYVSLLVSQIEKMEEQR